MIDPERTAESSAPTTGVIDDLKDQKGLLKSIGVSHSDKWNNTSANQLCLAPLISNQTAAERHRQ